MTHKAHLTSGLVNNGHTSIIVCPMFSKPDKRRMIFSNLDYQLLSELYETKAHFPVSYLVRFYEQLQAYHGVNNRLLYLLDRKVIDLVTKSGERIEASYNDEPYVKMTTKGNFLYHRYLRDIPYYELHGCT